MKVKNIRLKNISAFRDLEVNFEDEQRIYNHIIFIGNNGAGKTTILESIATSLSWYINRVRSEKGRGSGIKELSITNGENSGQIEINVSSSDSSSWQISKAKKGKKNETPSNLEGLDKLVNSYRKQYTQAPDSVSFPILTLYNAHRGVLDIPMRIRTKHKFDRLNGYDNSLVGMVDYRTFFEWFKERAEIENAEKVAFLNKIEEQKSGRDIKAQLEEITDRLLDCVRKALTTFLPNFKNIRVERKPTIHMAVDKDGEALNIEQLSQGEKLMMAMIGDIARRLAILNPNHESPLNGQGIVLIDEAELHLHPRWQRTLVANLNKTFPNCQFIYTTHSPLLISDYKEALCFSLDDGQVTPTEQLYGLDINQVLQGTMDTEVRNIEVQDLVDNLRERITGGKLNESENILNKLQEILPDNHIELVKARLLLLKLKKRHEKNN